jgi:hypothetical protein
MAVLWRFRCATGQRQAAAWLYEAKLEASMTLLETVVAFAPHSTDTAICPTAVEALRSIMRSCIQSDIWLSYRSVDDYFAPQSAPQYRAKPFCNYRHGASVVAQPRAATHARATEDIPLIISAFGLAPHYPL